MKENIQQLLSKVQRELKAPKGQMNRFGNYRYRSSEDILEAVKPLLGDLILTVSDEIWLVGDRYYVKATATVTLNDKSFVTTAYAREPFEKKGMDSAQITGATSSYARKYALNGLFCIDDTKDSDSTNAGEKVILVDEPTSDTKFFENIQPSEEDVIQWTESLESAKTLKELKEIAAKVPQMVKDKIGKAKFDSIKASLTVKK